ncbi:MAG: hypothetical protein WAU86_04835 [Oricola sp.]
MSSLLKDAKSIAVVGNGPVSAASADEIDLADLVIRFNYAAHCGCAGRRTDVLALNSTLKSPSLVARGKPINRLALRNAREIWLRDDKRDVAGALAFGLPVVEIDPDTVARTRDILVAHGANGENLVTSLGASTLRFILDRSDANIVLYGFTHRGWTGHRWDAEKAWVDGLIAAGRIERRAPAPPYARHGILRKIEIEAIRLYTHVRTFRF